MKMAKGPRLVATLLREESGQDLIEYALIAGLIALAAIGAVTTLGSALANDYESIGSSI